MAKRRDPLLVIYEDNHLIAVNKANGILVHEDATGDQTLEAMVKEYIKIRYHKPGDVYLGTLHRIDRPASGVVIFARTSKAAKRMSTLFHNGEIEKEYLALVDKRPSEISGRLTHYLLKNTETNTVKAYDQEKRGAKQAVLEYELAGQIDNRVLLRVKIFTGRPHQIRVQLKKIGCPINGDVKYGSPLSFSDQSIALHCRRMSFIHPVTKERIEITADLPQNIIWSAFDGLVQQENI